MAGIGRTDEEKRRRSSPHGERLERWEVKRRALDTLYANIISDCNDYENILSRYVC
jgi:hypothetical protein